VRATHWNTVFFPLLVMRRKFLPAPQNQSDVGLFPPPIEAVFNFGMMAERTWLRTVKRLPLGSSIFAVARKPVA